jgi:hypothetical protein
MSPIIEWSLFTIFVLVIAMAFWAFYYWWKKDRNTRERFAFFGFSSLLGFAGLYLSGIYLSSSIINGPIAPILKLLGSTTAGAKLTPIEAVIFFAVFLLLNYTFINIFKSWEGQKSRAQYEEEQNNVKASILRDVVLMCRLNREALLPYNHKTEQLQPVLEQTETLTWHERSRKLWLLHNRSYLFEGDYNPAYNCWVGEEKNTGALVILTCHHDLLKTTVDPIITYAKKVATNYNKKNFELIVALKDGDLDRTEEGENYIVKYITESTLLKDLIDFSDYYSDIKYKVERANLVDSELTLEGTYTPSFYALTKDGPTSKETLEAYIQQWLTDNTRRQLALLGEYGQGKSTTSLLLSYHLIEQSLIDSTTRIPILIELRGRSLRSLSAEELLASWALHYHIDVKALLHLHMAGRLLLIFEGFDEIDLSGDTEDRINHFSTIWQLNYEKAKIIITGRSNFFLDNEEIKRALGSTEQTQSLYLYPFDMKQIELGLRNFPPQTRKEIITLADRNLKFQDVVGRPSLLFMVASLWQRLDKPQRENINSATIIDLFIRQTLKRQQEKHNTRPFMILNSAERHYFMMGIAAYMGAKHLPNQVSNTQLNKAVVELIEGLPEVVSKSVSTVNGEDRRSLRDHTRFEWNTKYSEILNKIQTDVRSCGLLVSDTSKDGTFKFSHKSYMELLQAQAINQRMSDNEIDRYSGNSIYNIWNFSITELQDSDEGIGFLAELLNTDLNKRGVVEENAIANELLDVLVLGKIAEKVSYLTSIKKGTLFLVCKANSVLAKNKVCSLILPILLGLIILNPLVSIIMLDEIVIGSKISAGIYFMLHGPLFFMTLIVYFNRISSDLNNKIKEPFDYLLIPALVIMGFNQEVMTRFELTWLDSLVILMPLALACYYVTLLLSMLCDLIYMQRSPFIKRLFLWRRACCDLQLTSTAINSALGKATVDTLKVAEEIKNLKLKKKNK